jgi:hypothetical protein
MSKKWQRFAGESRKFIGDLKARSREAFKEYVSKHRRREEKGPEHSRDTVTDSTFLVIPAFDGDNGARPVAAGIATWHSPAVNIVDESADPNTSLESIQGTFSPNLLAGHTYLFEAWVHNLGDMVAPAVNVEFFLRSAGMGATAESARLIGSTVIAIGRNDRSRATVPFTASTGDLGHHCLLVRASSFNPPDLPDDWSRLVAREDRHIGQQNLNVVAGGSTMTMMLTAPAGRRAKATMRIRVRPASVPLHLKNNACLTNQITLDKGLAGAVFQFDTDVPFVKTARATNSWDMEVRRNETCTFRLTMPRTTQRSKAARVYDVEAYDVETKKVFDGVTVLVR